MLPERQVLDEGDGVKTVQGRQNCPNLEYCLKLDINRPGHS